MQALQEFGLPDAATPPIFDEATQTAAHFLNMPICTFGIPDRDRIWLKAAVGLSRIGLMNQLAASRQVPHTEELFVQTMQRQRPLAVSDAVADDRFAASLLVQQYGIRAFLGVPLLNSEGNCLGAMAIMDLIPRQFSDRDVQFLELMARWSISEWERSQLVQQTCFLGETSEIGSASVLRAVPNLPEPPDRFDNPALIKADLISQMSQDLSTPLTSILGMARVLSQGIYGTLTDKQQEYIEIIHNSGQYLLSLVNEILELGSISDRSAVLSLSPVDVEMLCQLTISSLSQAAERREQQIRLTIEPGLRLWMLDKEKVRQILYHLVSNVIQSSSSDSVIRIHGSRRQNTLQLMVWTSHPWLGDGLPIADGDSLTYAVSPVHAASEPLSESASESASESPSLSSAKNRPLLRLVGSDPRSSSARSRENLSLMLSHQLAELHQGLITVQGSPEEGYRYVIQIPQLQDTAAKG